MDGGKWSASRLGRFCREEVALGCLLDMRLGRPQSRSERCEEEKNLFSV
jgi:hypothetical protein